MPRSSRPPPRKTRQIDAAEMQRIAEASKHLPDACAAASAVEGLRKELHEARARITSLEIELEHKERRLIVIGDVVARMAKQIERIVGAS
jgi:hypothetical protein